MAWPVLLIGLTGGIGMGKSAVAEYLSNRGESVIDTDVLARELVDVGQPALADIKSAFGGAVIEDDGTLNRKALATLVFQNGESRKTLESILHPRIRAAWKQWAAKRAKEGDELAIVVIPLLFETAAEKEFDLIICVACSSSTQRSRLVERGWSQTEIETRIAAQMPVREKMEKANRVIWNESDLSVCEAQVARVFASLR